MLKNKWVRRALIVVLVPFGIVAFVCIGGYILTRDVLND